MLQFRNVYFKFGDKPLFEDMSFTVYAGHKIGIVGRNGVGKTTIFELILRRLMPDEGDIEYPRGWRVAALKQDITPSNRTALEFVMDGDTDLRGLERQIAQCERENREEDLPNLYLRFEDAGGYRYEPRAAMILNGLGFRHSDFGKPHREFSGGWRIRLNLAQTLMAPADLLLLDEPTNHLDLETTLWLQRWMGKFRGTIATIAHDRDFLDRVVSTIIHVDQLNARAYTGGYTAFEEQRAAIMAEEHELVKRQKQERERIQRFVDRFRSKATKARQVQSRIKALERMDKVVTLRDESAYRFSFRAPNRFDRPMLSLDECTVGYGSLPVVRNVTQRIYPQDRIGILGLNGAGKTTLLRTLAAEITTLAGTVKRSDRTSVGYFAQHQLEILDDSLSAQAHVLKEKEMSDQDMRNYLGMWGFRGDDIFRPVRQFSGGERARLVLSKIALYERALLVLDEPTNHLDIEMRAALSDALNQFEGAIVVVAHDQHLLRQCINEFWLVRDGQLSIFEGDLDDYEALVNEQRDKLGTSGVSTSRERRKQRADTRNRQRDLQQRRRVVEDLLERLEQELQELVDKFSDPSSFENEPRWELNRWIEQHGKKKKRLEELEAEWIAIEERLSSESN